MPEVPEEKLHRNRPYSVPTIGQGGPMNCFSRGDFLTGKSPVKFGPGQPANAFTKEEIAAGSPAPAVPTPELWPTDWPMAGRLLTVPRVVVLSDFIAWPEFWERCAFDYPRDVLGELFTNGRLTTYYYLDQWNIGRDWRTTVTPGADDNEYRFEQDLSGGFGVENPSYAQHRQLWTVFREAKRILENQDDPVYVVLGNWIPHSIYEIYTRNHFRAWSNDDAYWPGYGQAQTDVLHGHSGCDTFHEGTNRSRTHPDATAPYWRSECDDPPPVPCLACPTPFFGTNVLHLWFGHWCMNWGGAGLLNYETYPLSPAGIQTGPILNGNYLGAAADGLDGKRIIWRDAGLNYGYMTPYTTLLDNYASRLAGAAANYKENFWKYRDFGVRFVPWTRSWEFNLLPFLVADDQKWCAAGAFYFGFSFEEFQALVSNEDQYAVDYSAETHDVKFANTISRNPDSPTIRQAIEDFDLFYDRVKAYYSDSSTGLNAGTENFLTEMISRHQLAEYNVAMTAKAERDALFTVDGLVEYVNNYFKVHP
jgi:hypothetical protein